MAVGTQNWLDGRLAVDAQHQRGWLIGYAGDGGHGDAVAAGGTAGGNHMHTGGHIGHGVAVGLGKEEGQIIGHGGDYSE